MMKVIMKWIIFMIFLIFSVQGVSAAITVGSILIDPPGSLSSNTPVTVSFKIENSGVFPSDGELQMITDLDNPEWTYTIIVNGIENLRPVMGGRTLTISGFELNYRTSDEVSVRVTLEGVAPAVTHSTDIMIVCITEYDGNGNPITIVGTDPVTITPVNLKSKIGVFRPSTHLYYLDFNGNGVWDGAAIDRVSSFGITGDIPVSGDWNKDGKSEIGVFRPSTRMYYRDFSGNGVWDGGVIDRVTGFGITGDIPVSGDWNKDGKSEIGVFRPSTHMYYQDYNGNGIWDGAAISGYDRVSSFGITGDIPVSGDWNADGRTEIGVFRPSTHLYYRDYNGNGVWDWVVVDQVSSFGITGDIPVSGDWNADGRTEIGVFRPSTHLYYQDYNGNGVWNGALVDRVYNFGISGDIPVSGNWSSIQQPSRTITFTKDLTIIPCTSVSIPVGGKIIWKNDDPLHPHGVAAIDNQGAKYFGGLTPVFIPYTTTFEVTFDAVGTFNYTTIFQPVTTGRINVTLTSPAL
jgi:hypothetical protein